MQELTKFQNAALNYKQHIALTANAGSGKTTILCKRYVNIILEANVHVKDIAAITFTEKAASELYDAITEEISERLEVCKKQKLSATKEDTRNINFRISKLENIRRDLVFSKISTIHSFCLDILKENPVEANIDANCIPIDDKIASDFINQSIEEVTKELIDCNDEEIKSLIRQFSDIRILSKNIYDAVKKQIVTDKLKDFYSKDVFDIANFYSQTCSHLYKSLYADVLPNIIALLNNINNTVLISTPNNSIAVAAKNLLHNLNSNDYSEMAIKTLQELLENVCTNSGTIKIPKYFSKKMREANPELVEGLISYSDEITSLHKNSSPNSSYNIELAGFGKKFFSLYSKIVEKYKEKKSETGYLDFEDILILTQKLLANPLIQKQISDKYKFVMVDEYQDTNSIQYEIILPVVDFLNKGNLFVVGDEKQSIYGFRNAEIKVFDDTKNDIGKNPQTGTVLTMPDNFRMVPEICLFTNKIFNNLFSDFPNLLFNEVKNSPLVYGRPDKIKGKVEFLSGNSSDETSDREADLVAKRILNLVINESNLLSKNPAVEKAESVLWKNIAILSRKRKSFDRLIPVLTKYKIPYVFIKGQGFYQRQEIIDIYNYLSFLLDEHNDSALISILRSPFFLISDLDLYAISLENGNCFYDKLINFSYFRADFVYVKDLLNENLKLIHSSNIVFLIRKLLQDNYYLALASQKDDGKQIISNIEKLINMASDSMTRAFHNVFDFVDMLEKSINAEEKESLASVIEDSNAVNLTVVHQVKGLEYPVVFLFDSHSAGQTDNSKSKKIAVDKDFGIITKISLNDNFFSGDKSSLIIDLINNLNTKKEEAELKRLLYVAITRARNLLCISFETNKNIVKNSFLNLINYGLVNILDIMPNEINIEGELLCTNGETLNLKYNIPVITSMETPGNVVYNETKEILPKYLTEKIIDFEQDEVISATKISIYNQCPVKYQLTYNYGMKNLVEGFDIKEKSNNVNPLYEKLIDTEIKESDEAFSISGKEKGIIVHFLLQNDMKVENLTEEIIGSLMRGNKDHILNKNDDSSISEIISLISNYKNSSSFKFISSFLNYKNEFEIYIKINDYFLFGVIDRIIFDYENNKIIIVDYKTDNIKLNDIKKRKENYTNQLKFYSYIASKLFQNFETFELLLVFIKHPDHCVSEVLTKQNIDDFGISLQNVINNIRTKNFIKNTNHCSICNYNKRYKDCIMDVKD